MESTRKPEPTELKLIELLVSKSAKSFPKNWSETLRVRNMQDGGMGSLLLFPNEQIDEERVFGEQISDFRFLDEDGVEVIASLNVDEMGELFELDMWKTDYSKLIKWPL